MTKMTIADKIRANRTRKAVYQDEEISVRVYAESALKEIQSKMQGGEDDAIAAFLAEQFIDQSGQPVFTKEFFLSDDCPLCVVVELTQLFMEVNAGKKN